LIEEMKKQVEEQLSPVLTHENLKSPTEPRWYKVNFDGALKGSLGIAGAGGIVRDCQGKIRLAFYRYFGE
jgi:hypothetical protein